MTRSTAKIKSATTIAKNLAGLLVSTILLAGYYNFTYRILCGNRIVLHQELSASSEQLPKVWKIPQYETQDSRTTVIVTSSLIPSHPAIWMINETISSIAQYLIGLEPDYRLILPVDGYRQGVKPRDRKRLYKYRENLERAYPEATVLANVRAEGLTKNTMRAIANVSTEFVYLVQHDMPFVSPIQHTDLMKASRETQGYPFNVRFNKIYNIDAKINKGPCWNAKTILSNLSGLSFIKTPSWSDNNQFATTAYYRHIFAEWISPNYEKKPMEFRMQQVSKNTEEESCLGYGQYLYGREGDRPRIGHLDGRRTPAAAVQQKT